MGNIVVNTVLTEEQEADEIVRRLQTAGRIDNNVLTAEIYIYPVKRIRQVPIYIMSEAEAEAEADKIIEKLKAPPKKTLRTLGREWGFEITDTIEYCVDFDAEKELTAILQEEILKGILE